MVSVKPIVNLVFPSPRQKLIVNRSHVLTLTCLGQPALPAMGKFARCARRSCPWRVGSRTNPAKKRSDLTRSDLAIVENNLKVYFASVHAILMVDDFEF